MTDASHSDGSVIIRVNVNAAEADKELVRLTKKINALNERISDKKQDQMPLVEQSKQLAAVLDDAKAKLYEKRRYVFYIQLYKGARADSSIIAKRMGWRAKKG